VCRSSARASPQSKGQGPQDLFLVPLDARLDYPGRGFTSPGAIRQLPTWPCRADSSTSATDRSGCIGWANGWEKPAIFAKTLGNLQGLRFIARNMALPHSGAAPSSYPSSLSTCRTWPKHCDRSCDRSCDRNCDRNSPDCDRTVLNWAVLERIAKPSSALRFQCLVRQNRRDP
jgi:hypothetical protein